jgi:hypothetical protein
MQSPLSRSICSLAEPAFGPRVFRNLDVEGHDNGQGKLEPRGRGALAGGKQARKGGRSDRKALDELKDMSGHLKERIAGEKERPEFPVDDDPPGDTEEALRGPEER